MIAGFFYFHQISNYLRSSGGKERFSVSVFQVINNSPKIL